MAEGTADLFAGIAVALLILSGFWAEVRFRRFRQLPAHYDIAGRPTRYASRSFVIWLTPVIFVALIGLIVFLVRTMPSEQINGDPQIGVLISSLTVLGAQALVLWLTERWARGQI